MPIDKSEFESGKILTDIEKAVIAFLRKNPDQAFTANEIMDGIRLQTSFADFWKAIASGIVIVGFSYLLNNLVISGKIRQNIISGTYYYMAK